MILQVVDFPAARSVSRVAIERRANTIKHRMIACVIALRVCCEWRRADAQALTRASLRVEELAPVLYQTLAGQEKDKSIFGLSEVLRVVPSPSQVSTRFRTLKLE